jgi:hypothetical protein
MGPSHVVFRRRCRTTHRGRRITHRSHRTTRRSVLSFRRGLRISVCDRLTIRCGRRTFCYRDPAFRFCRQALVFDRRLSVMT